MLHHDIKPKLTINIKFLIVDQEIIAQEQLRIILPPPPAAINPLWRMKGGGGRLSERVWGQEGWGLREEGREMGEEL